MFDQKDSRIDNAYLQTQETVVDTAAKLADLLKELLKALYEKWQEKRENDKVAVKTDEETYNLVEDPDTPGAYKWEKVNLNKESTASVEAQPAEVPTDSEVDANPWASEAIQIKATLEQPFTDYQAQTIARRLITGVPDINVDEDYTSTPPRLPPAIQITVSSESGEIIILYEQAQNGKIIKNAFTEELSQEEILDLAYEPLSNLLPSGSPLLLPPAKGNIEESLQSETKNIAESASNMLSQVVDITEIKFKSEQIQYDSDGLIIEDDNESTPEIPIQPAVNEPEPVSKELDNSIEIDEFTNFEELPHPNTSTPTKTPTPETTSKEESAENSTFISVEQQALSNNQDSGNINIEATEMTTRFNNEYINNSPSLDNIMDVSYEELNSTLDTRTNELTSSEEKQSGATFIAGTTATQVRTNRESENTLSETTTLTLKAEKPKVEATEESGLSSSLAIKNQNVELQEEPSTPANKKIPSEAQEEPAAAYTYQKVASNPEVEPRAQQWAKQSTVPLYKINHRGERARAEFENNKDIAKAATEMIKKYGTIETNGSIIYRSDAFIIRKEAGKEGMVSVHRRGDEAKGFVEPLMEFKLDDKNKPIIKKGNLLNNLRNETTKHSLSPVEKQEFLIVAERINEGKELPNLQTADIREMGNTLGSLAPAGTLRTLKVFKETEVLEILNSTLNQAKRDEVTTGDFTIKRERDPENENRVSLTLTKDSNDGRGVQKLVQFDLEKTENGIESKVTKMNISDYDISQIKEIAKNYYKRNQNLEINFNNYNQQAISKQTTAEIDTINIGTIPVEVHPWIQKEWVQMVDELEENPPHTSEIQEGLGEIQGRMNQNKGKASIPDQCVMYDKIVTHKVAMAQESNDPNATVTFINKNDIINDLKELRQVAIYQEFTSVENLTEKQKNVEQQTHATPRPIPRPKQTQTVEL